MTAEAEVGPANFFKKPGKGSNASAQDAGARDREVDRLYAEGRSAWLGGDHVGAENFAKAALALDSTLPALHYLVGLARFERGYYSGATEALESCLERQPKYPLAQHARARWALARARLDTSAPSLEQLSAAAVPVSVIICSVTPSKFERVQANYTALLAGMDHEIIGIHDARSLAEGYNRGIRRARGEALVFSHDDIEILAPDFAARLMNRMAESDLIGVAGTDRVCGGAWTDAGWPHVFGQVGTPRPDGRINATTYVVRGAGASPMQALDGVFFAARRAVVEKIRFDESTFDGWHLYDLAFSYAAALAGFRLTVCNDFLLAHQSEGGYGEAWLRYARKFVAGHVKTIAPEDYAFTQLELCALGMDSASEWRRFTHHLVSGAAPG